MPPENEKDSAALKGKARPAYSSKHLLRRAVGDTAYRTLTQTPRIANFLLRPNYEPEIYALPQLVPSNATCFDIGANYGLYSRVLSPMAGKAGKIYAFEPSRMTFRGLKMCTLMLGLKNVQIHQCAMSDGIGELTLTIPAKAHGGLGIALAHLGAAEDTGGTTEIVHVDTLDHFVNDHHITACDFIKCDVEGAELRVLQGGIETLTR